MALLIIKTVPSSMMLSGQCNSGSKMLACHAGSFSSPILALGYHDSSCWDVILVEDGMSMLGVLQKARLTSSPSLWHARIIHSE